MIKKLIFFLSLLLTKSVSFCQCDNTLKPSDNPAVSYKARGDRCEGAYAAKVGAPSLDLVSFTIGKLSYKLDKSEIIEIKNLSGSNIYIRAAAMPLNTYYRMDAYLEKTRTLKWDVKDVLFSLKIPSNSLGVYGWSGSEKNKIFIPVKPVSSITDPSDNKLYLIIRSSAKVLGGKYRYSQSGLNSSAYENISGLSRPGQPIVIVLPGNLAGEYNIEVAALLESKSDWVKNNYQISIK